MTGIVRRTALGFFTYSLLPGLLFSKIKCGWNAWAGMRNAQCAECPGNAGMRNAAAECGMRNAGMLE